MSEAMRDLFAEFEARAVRDPRLEQFRVPPGGPAALDWVPDGWFTSDAVRGLAVEGGWWPGWWVPGQEDGGTDQCLPLHLAGLEREHDVEARRTVPWMVAGTVWERDLFLTPLLRHPVPSAPLLGFSSQSLWHSLVFPHEAALLESFLITYDEIGVDEVGNFELEFPEWFTPDEYLTDDERRVSDLLVERSRTWRTDHPCWDATTMPLLAHEPWPPTAAAAALGLSDLPQ